MPGARKTRGRRRSPSPACAVWRRTTPSACGWLAPEGQIRYNRDGKTAKCSQVQGRPPTVIARSEATWQSASPAAAQAKRNYSRRIRRSCGFALGIANLLGFPAGLRIATPVCALVRNDMQKGARCLHSNPPVRNDMQKTVGFLRLQGGGSQ